MVCGVSISSVSAETKDTWEKGTSVEGLPTSDWLVHMPVRYFLDEGGPSPMWVVLLMDR